MAGFTSIIIFTYCRSRAGYSKASRSRADRSRAGYPKEFAENLEEPVQNIVLEDNLDDDEDSRSELSETEIKFQHLKSFL